MQSDDTTDSNESNDELSLQEVCYWLRFGGWVTLALIPMLYFVNGPAVSLDQYVVRCGLVVIAIILGPLWCGVRMFWKSVGCRVA